MTTFEQLGLDAPILKAITELGFENPTDIQQQAIPIFMAQENDLIALAQTGTGKTAAFGLPIIQHLDTNSKKPQALIVSPTRELCMQITSDLKNYSKYINGVKITAVYGGSSITQQIKDIRSGAQIIVATPGRLIDLINRGAVKLDEVQIVVLDEADEMLNMGFQEDMETILAETPETKITGLFSATMPKEIRRIASQYIKNPIEVASGNKNEASKNITHQYAITNPKDKLEAVTRIVDMNADFYGIIFCTTRIETQTISDALVKSGYSADCLHGDLSQQQRDKVMGKFRTQAIQILVATDVAARGIDVNNLTHVLHFRLPDDIENYTHRSGRTARAGNKGISIALIHGKEMYKLNQLQKMAGVDFEKFVIPSGKEIIETRIKAFIENFAQQDVSKFDLSSINEELLLPMQLLSKEDMIARILQNEMQKISAANTKMNNDINANEGRGNSKSEERGRGERDRRGSSRDRDFGGERSERRSRGGQRDDDANTRMFINLGKKDGIRYDELREMIFNATKVSGHNVKDIDFSGVYSFFQTDEASAKRIVEGFNNVEFKGREVRVQFASEQKNGGGERRERSFGGERSSGDRKSFGTNAGRGFNERSSKREGGFKGRKSAGEFGGSGDAPRRKRVSKD